MRTSAMPDTCRTCDCSCCVKALLAATLNPLTWISIGAGAPKFRIWLTMSAGRKAKLTPGYASGNDARN